MSKIVITGASGFIGQHLVHDLIRRGHQVLCLGRSSDSLRRITADVDKQVTDYSLEHLKGLTRDFQILVHLAGRRLTREDDPDYVSPFTEQTVPQLDNLLRAAKVNSFQRVVTASSIGVYSLANQTPWSEDEIPLPATAYGVSKLLGEQITDFWGRKNAVSTAHIRLAQCFGHGEKTTPALMHMADKAARREKLTVKGGGKFNIDQIYVEDAVRAFALLIESDLNGPFNIGAGCSYSVAEIATNINSVFENVGNMVVEQNDGSPSPEPLRHMDITRAREKLGWEPLFSLHDGLSAMREAAMNENKDSSR